MPTVVLIECPHLFKFDKLAPISGHPEVLKTQEKNGGRELVGIMHLDVK